MFTVGPRSTPAPLARASSASTRPTWRTRSRFQVAASADPHGKLAEFPTDQRWPRAPAGPSVTRSGPIPRRSMDAVCQKSIPAVSAARSARVRSSAGRRTTIAAEGWRRDCSVTDQILVQQKPGQTLASGPWLPGLSSSELVRAFHQLVSLLICPDLMELLPIRKEPIALAALPGRTHLGTIGLLVGSVYS